MAFLVLFATCSMLTQSMQAIGLTLSVLSALFPSDRHNLHKQIAQDLVMQTRVILIQTEAVPG